MTTNLYQCFFAITCAYHTVILMTLKHILHGQWYDNYTWDVEYV